MTNYSGLIKDNRIKAGKFSRKQVKDCLSLAERDIATARKIVVENPDWGYNIAYNAMLQAARASCFPKVTVQPARASMLLSSIRPDCPGR